MSANALFILAIVIIAALGLFVIPRFRMKRAVVQVIQIFRQHSALNEKNARTIDELGLRPRTMMEGMMKGRDFRPYALQALMKAEAILTTEEGKLYLSEDKLYSSGLERR